MFTLRRTGASTIGKERWILGPGVDTGRFRCCDGVGAWEEG